MSPDSFCKLASLLRNYLEPKNVPTLRGDHLDVETKMMVMLCMLAGGQYIDQCHCNGINKLSVYKAFRDVINAINANLLYQ